MKRFLTALMLMLLVVAVAVPLVADAQEAGKKGKKKKGRQAGAAAALKKQLEEVELTAEQKEKIEAIIAKHSAAITEAQQDVSELLTPEQRRARAAAMKAARDAGKKGKDARADVEAAIQLSPEAKAKLAEAEKAARDAQMKLRQEVAAVLTPEQREEAGLQTRQAGKKAKKKKQ